LIFGEIEPIEKIKEMLGFNLHFWSKDYENSLTFIEGNCEDFTSFANILVNTKGVLTCQ